MKDLYTKLHKTLMKEIQEDTNKWQDTPCSWIRRILLNCPYYPKQPKDSVQSLSKFQWHFSQK